MADMHVARRPFLYAGQQLDWMQITETKNALNDEKLLRLEYLIPLTASHPVHECRVCGACFADLRARDTHGRKRHPDPSLLPLTPQEEDAAIDSEEAMLNVVAPINLEKTTASRK